jgi:predicted nucleic acid-binding protein
MVVIADTSPLNYLILVGHADVLPELYGEVVIPPAVLRELQHFNAPVPYDVGSHQVRLGCE